MSYYQEAKANAKKVHKAVWVAAVVLPLGIVGLTAYLAVRAYVDNKKAKNES